jgi:hypothetical protein
MFLEQLQLFTLIVQQFLKNNSPPQQRITPKNTARLKDHEMKG